MNDAQFDVICKLTRGREDSPANQAARLVLVGGWTQAEAGHETSATRSMVSDAVRRFSASHELILSAYGTRRARP